MLKTRLDKLGTVLGVFWILKIFQKHFEDSTLNGTVGKTNFSKKLPQNMLKTRVYTFGNDFRHFSNFANFLIFWNHFEDSTLHGTLGKKNFEKITPKLVQNTFGHIGNDFGRFLNFENFLIFWKHFEDSTLLGTLSKKVFRKKYPKTCWKHVWTNWGRFWAFFEFWKFFKNISKTRPSLEHWAKNFWKKFFPKHVQNTFGQTGNVFGRFLVFEFF